MTREILPVSFKIVNSRCSGPISIAMSQSAFDLIYLRLCTFLNLLFEDINPPSRSINIIALHTFENLSNTFFAILTLTICLHFLG